MIGIESFGGTKSLKIREQEKLAVPPFGTFANLCFFGYCSICHPEKLRNNVQECEDLR